MNDLSDSRRTVLPFWHSRLSACAIELLYCIVLYCTVKAGLFKMTCDMDLKAGGFASVIAQCSRSLQPLQPRANSCPSLADLSVGTQIPGTRTQPQPNKRTPTWVRHEVPFRHKHAIRVLTTGLLQVYCRSIIGARYSTLITSDGHIMQLTPRVSALYKSLLS